MIDTGDDLGYVGVQTNMCGGSASEVQAASVWT